MDLKIYLDMPPWEWPPDAGKMFRKALNDRRANPSDRLVAAELAGDSVVIDDSMANALLAVVRSPAEPEQLRAKAAISFGPALEMAWTELDEDRESFVDTEIVPITEEMFHDIVESLQALYRDTNTPKQVRRRIVEASVRAPQPWHEEAVRDAYGSGDQEWVLTAVFAMRFIRGFESEALASLGSADPEIHFQAVVAAGNKELDAAWPHIFALVKNDGTEKDLRIAAIGAIAQIRADGAGEILVELADSEDEDIADAADEALSLMETPPDDEDDEDESIN